MTGGGRSDAEQEFLAEAQELVEGMSRDLLLLEQSMREGEPSAELLNGLFRGVHTLKGLSGMFGFHTVGRLAHVLEDLLDHTRLGRATLDASTMDVLFQGVESFTRLLASGRETGATPQIDVEDFGARVRAVIRARASKHDPLEDYELDSSLLSVLTEYEEHRLRTHLERGHRVVRVGVRLPLDAIEQSLEQLKQRIAPVGEVLSYLPSVSGDDPDLIGLELLIATTAGDDDLRGVLAIEATLTPVRRRIRGSLAPPRQQSVPPGAPPGSAGTAAGATQAAAAADTNAIVIPDAAATVDVGRTQLSLRSLTNVVRVDVRKLDHLMNAVAELGTVRSMFTRLLERLPALGVSRDLLLDAQRMQRSFDRRLTEVQTAVLDVRMVPLSQVFDKLAVAVRQLAREQGKRVQLVVKGADTEVDKLIAEEIADPLMHLVRNAIDHGIEDEPTRIASQKQPLSRLTVHAYQRGNQVVLEITDDGRGIDHELIGKVAVERGVLRKEELAELSPRDMLELIFMPAFSTRADVSDVSGRGVGLDVVKTNVQRLGGTVEVRTVIGVSTTFVITLPITLAIIRALVFQVRGRLMSIPLAAVQEVSRLEAGAIRTIEGREALDLRGSTLPLSRLGQLLRLSAPAHGLSEQHVIVLLAGNRRLGLVVERLLGQQDIVIKPLGPSLRAVRGIAGATDLGGQQLVLVLEAAALLDEVLAGKGSRLSVGGVA
jgi:two-component system chemotaxis sensor kinase CheA